jgi:hypothetical protein
MLRIDRSSNKLRCLPSRKLAEVGLLERSHVQKMIRQSADEFFAELGETLLLIGEEVQPTDFVADRIDLLAIDTEGVAIVIEIKRGADKLQLLQAIPYAGMLSKWSDQQLREQYQAFCNRHLDDPHIDLDEFLGPNVNLNQQQRIILLAEEFDYEVLVCAEWLTEKYGMDIRCFRLALAIDGDDEFLTCTCIYPPPEIAEQAKKRGRGESSEHSPWASWNEALQEVQNKAVVEFFKTELTNGRKEHLGSDPNLRFAVGGKNRFRVYPRPQFAYVWALGRFDDDIQFWKTHLKDNPEPEPVSYGANLRFYLRSEGDLNRFREIVDKELRADQFRAPAGHAEIEE